MGDNEIKGNLAYDVDSLNEESKKKYADTCHQVISDVNKKKGKARRTRVEIPSKDNKDIEVVAIDKNIPKRPYPTAKDKLKVIGLSNGVETTIANKIFLGKVNSSHINDIQNLGIVNKLVDLDADSQATIVEEIFENRNQRDLINAEIISSFSLRNDDFDTLTLETWYRGMVRLIDKLSKHADVDKDTLSHLSEDQTNNLNDKIKVLLGILEKLIM